MSKPNPNENCLAGMACPYCGSFGPFSIRAECTVEVTDDGTGDTKDFEWGEHSHICCCACNQQGTVAEFTSK